MSLRSEKAESRKEGFILLWILISFFVFTYIGYISVSSDTPAPPLIILFIIPVVLGILATLCFNGILLAIWLCIKKIWGN
jgi:hypothetical protein